jgi:hypothetical protein
MTGVVTFALLSLLDVLLLQYCVKIETMYTGERTPEIAFCPKRTPEIIKKKENITKLNMLPVSLLALFYFCMQLHIP